jgi:KDO2-lipid IV(A) lauroyltransferase
MRHRSAIRNYFEYGLALLVLKSLEFAPLPLAHWLARRYVSLLDLAIPRLRRVAYRNLSMALPDANATAIVDGVFRSIARTIVTFAKFPSIRKDNVATWIRCEGGEYFERALREGRGVLFATAHMGNWELSAYAHALLREPMNVVVRPLDNPLIDRLVERRRGLSGNHAIFKKDFARSILKALAANQAVGILIDQNASLDAGTVRGNGGDADRSENAEAGKERDQGVARGPGGPPHAVGSSVFVDFFGLSACAGTGFAKLAAHSGAAVIPGFALWSEEERGFVLRFYPPVPITGDAALDTQTIQARLEEVIRTYPDQWLWIHRRWKTRPPGEPSLYETTPGRGGASKTL